MSPPADTSLANRYGSKKQPLPRAVKRGIAVAGLAAGIGFLAWVSTSSAVSGVTSKDIGFSTVDAT
ncbi:MAG TPA: DUF4307 domain-containing protein, partial [Arthrobacter bacterium]|nr:DUF4307 domain-containing protein [Arthrobacter sp.]